MRVTKQGMLSVGALMVLWTTTGCVFHRTQGDYFNSNGVRIHYTSEGQGEPVVLVHGVAVNADEPYRKFALRCLSLDALVQESTGVVLTPRQLDNVLLYGPKGEGWSCVNPART